METAIIIKQVVEKEDFESARKLILEYSEWLGFDLSFQNFNKEMETIYETYSSANGRLFIALLNSKAVGVAGIKKFTDSECELKRMFVQPDCRGLGIGKLLLSACIALAKELHFNKVKLDTTGFMKPAINLYREFGFVEITAYRHNPRQDAKYFELELKNRLA